MRPATAGPVFAVRGLGKTYGSGATRVQALRDADFDIEAGEFIVLLGPSGSGKSTLLNILGGLDTADAGSVRWRGQELAGANEATLTHYRRQHIGFVFQFYNLIGNLTAEENVQLATDLVDDPLPAAEALARVGLADRRHHFPAELSGGEQQRVAIARALAKRPACLLCDEPTGALDCQTGRQVLQALADANRELGTTTLVITHNAVIARMADRILQLRDGRIESITRNAQREPASALDW
jgi:putative ABC transport system ATP-binding protein